MDIHFHLVNFRAACTLEPTPETELTTGENRVTCPNCVAFLATRRDEESLNRQAIRARNLRYHEVA